MGLIPGCSNWAWELPRATGHEEKEWRICAGSFTNTEVAEGRWMAVSFLRQIPGP